MPRLSIEKLSAIHNTESFDCEQPELNRFLLLHALQSQQSNSAQTYVACRAKRVIGYYSLVVGGVTHQQAPKRITKGLAKHPVPLMILARLAVTKKEQGQGVGRGLLKDALMRTAQAAGLAGIRALVVHAKDEVTRAWYQQFDFASSPTDPLHLYLLIKDLHKIIRANRKS